MNYLRNIKLCNKYSEFIKEIRLSNDKKLNTTWDETTVVAWGNCISKCAASIKGVLDLSISTSKNNFFNELLSEPKTKSNYKSLSPAILKISK